MLCFDSFLRVLVWFPQVLAQVNLIQEGNRRILGSVSPSDALYGSEKSKTPYPRLLDWRLRG